jgi:hypothetical protein
MSFDFAVSGVTVEKTGTPVTVEMERINLRQKYNFLINQQMYVK